jgi:hypothetical protein
VLAIDLRLLNYMERVVGCHQVAEQAKNIHLKPGISCGGETGGPISEGSKWITPRGVIEVIHCVQNTDPNLNSPLSSWIHAFGSRCTSSTASGT